MYIMIQDWETVEKKKELYGIEGYLLWFLFCRGLYDLQILHTASLVGQD